MKNNIAFRCLYFLFGVFILQSCNDDSKDNVVFIGDSLIMNWDVERQFPYLNTENKGIDGNKISDCMNIELSYPGDKIVLLIGTNDLESSDVSSYIDSLCKRYLELVDAIEAKHIYCISILPKRKFPTDEIRKVNSELSKLLQNKAKVSFIDVFEDFIYKNEIDPQLTTDGTHLTPYGYDILAKKLQEVL